MSLALMISFAAGGAAQDTPKDAPKQDAPKRVAQKKVDFVADILPILKDRCYECHGNGKDEGDLRIDVKASVFSTDHADPMITPGKPDRSMIYQRVILPEDDPDVMPAKGKPLTKPQIDQIKRWIEEGASWPDSASAAAPIKSVTPPPIVVPELDAAGTRALETLSKRGATALRVSSRSNAVYVNLSLLARDAGDAEVALLKGLEKQLVWLHLGRTAVGDSGVAGLAGFGELRRLHLEQTAITDAALVTVGKLSKLEYLNLYGTAVSDVGLAALGKLTSLRKLYLWQSKVSAGGVAALKKALPELVIDTGDYVAELEKVAAEEAAKAEALKAALPVNDVCPVSGKKVQPSAVLTHKGERIGFCCEKCVAAFAKKPDDFLPKLVRVARAPKGEKPPGEKKQ